MSSLLGRRTPQQGMPEEMAWYDLRTPGSGVRRRFGNTRAEGACMTTIWQRVGWSIGIAGFLVACSSQQIPQTTLLPNTPGLESVYQDGRLAFKAQRYPEAVRHFARVAAGDPGHLKARLNWAAALSYSNKPAEAIVQCQNVLDSDPTNAEAYYQWGAVLVRQGQHQEALEKIEQALALKPITELLQEAPAMQQSLRAYLSRQRPQRTDAEVVRPSAGGDSSQANR